MREIYSKEELRSTPILSLAFVGDGVHTLLVRTGAFAPKTKNNDLHALSSAYCCAQTQAKAAKKMEPLLREDEAFIFRKGKNANVGSVPKNATLMDYKLATAFEAVVGYLYLAGEDDRMKELIEESYKGIE